ncbi:serine hydrolase domain-containing protein [Niabella beijingensis]|uniref:serine hydrolase domain-containing protein n=1 Tax=Niabella beijingensis TaxID=2872700 RepID=UPI001CBD2259|nr:serine hydrolase domain-containing protein [Niabella beijingensis]MBZ4190062.1 beta-lactamase family protein [Niabella beijingensis]
MRLLPQLLLVCCTCFYSRVALTQKNLSRSIEKDIDQLVEQRLPDIAPGAVILLAQGDRILYHKAFGYENTTTKTKMDKDGIFRIGSITKPFTALAILQLVQENKLKLQDTLQQYIPDFPVKKYPVTIAQLLTHTSGIKNYFEIENPALEKDHYTPREGISYFQDAPLQFQPGSRYQYSNSNYYLLGYIIEQVSGMSYNDFLQMHIFNVAGLQHTSYGSVASPALHLVKGYSKLNGRIEDAELEEITSIYAAGGLLSNAGDLLRWHRVLYDGKLISNGWLNKATQSYRLSDGKQSEYGYGWFISDIDGTKTIEHSGSTDGYQSDLVYIPDRTLRIITLFNCYETDRDWILLTNDIARLAMGKSLDHSIRLSKEMLQQYVGIYKHNEEWQMIFTMKGSDLYVRCPKAGIPDIKLYATNENYFYTKETPIKFELLKQPDGSMLLVTYNNSGKDAEWKRVEGSQDKQ